MTDVAAVSTAFPASPSGSVIAPTAHRQRLTLPLLLLAAAGGAVAVSLGVYGRVHQPTGGTMFHLGYPTLRAMKAGLATVAASLVAVQITSALVMFGRMPLVRSTPRWIPFVHRWSGTVAFVASLPVAYHCLWALGFQSAEHRALVHGLFGCAFYGAMTTKLLALRAGRLPRWALPVMGSLVALTLTAAWLTSALWFYTGFSIVP